MKHPFSRDVEPATGDETDPTAELIRAIIRCDGAAVAMPQAEYDAWLDARIAGVLKRLADGTEKMLSPEESKEAVRKLREDLLAGRLGR